MGMVSGLIKAFFSEMLTTYKAECSLGWSFTFSILTCNVQALLSLKRTPFLFVLEHATQGIVLHVLHVLIQIRRVSSYRDKLIMLALL